MCSVAATGGPSGPASGTGQYSDSGTDIQMPPGPDQGGPIQGTRKGASGSTTAEAPQSDAVTTPGGPTQGGPIQGTTKAPSGGSGDSAEPIKIPRSYCQNGERARLYCATSLAVEGSRLREGWR